MHITVIKHESEEYVILHNGDFSGDVRIVCPVERTTVRRTAVGYETEIPFVVLWELVGQAARDERIARLEQLTGTEYLKSLR